jgi:hypothetical protein
MILNVPILSKISKVEKFRMFQILENLKKNTQF